MSPTLSPNLNVTQSAEEGTGTGDALAGGAQGGPAGRGDGSWELRSGHLLAGMGRRQGVGVLLQADGKSEE